MVKLVSILLWIILPGALPARGMQAQERPIVYTVPGMQQVRARKNITYKKAGAVELKMDLYSPPNSGRGARLPVVIFIPGGIDPRVEPKPKDWPAYVSWGRLAAASGMIGVTFTHRLGFPRRQYEEGASDLLDLIAYLRANAASFNIDGERLCLVAYSGGGPLLSVPLRDRPGYVRCIMGFYTFLDTGHVDPEQAGTTRQVIQAFSPINHLASSAGKVPPIFIARAGRDQIAAVNESIDRFVKVAVENNAPLDFINHPEGTHGFDARDDVPRTREIIEKAIAFMKAHLFIRGQGSGVGGR